ncbi:hypothetical protein BDQ12DRAFT_727819 [Crucibulum laeve]|uniref:Uncharacterized protein n=1 Tax=Crucibulum laeve TaxID=68775 RepID=A0A5C3LL47_9AGAR|nr:hypothetical protein BDQ12DRAFT_727819 [Crucibulum laeve]
MAAAPVPDFQLISQHLIEIGRNFALLPVPPPPDPDIHQRLQQIMDAITTVQENIATMQRSIDAMQENIATIQQDVVHIWESVNNLNRHAEYQPTRSYNTRASLNAALQYPSNTALPPNAPTDPASLLDMSRAMCQALAGSLGLPALPPATTIQQRRQQIIDFLGCGLVAL